MKLALICALVAAQLAASPALAQEDFPDDEEVLVEPRIEAPLDADAKRTVEGINAFSLDLYKRSVSAEKNLFVSPASVSTAVALAYRGARGQTADELRATMHYGAPPESYLRFVSPILKSLNFSGSGRQLRVSNALWLQNDLPLLPEFAADVARYASTGLQRVDFRSDPEAARLTINRWVAAATQDRIPNLLLDGEVTDATRIALVNTVYWKGQWDIPFSTKDTKAGPFTGLRGNRATIPLMHADRHFRVVARGGIKAIEMPYVSGEVSMVVLLPDSPKALPRFESRLTTRELTAWLDALDAAEGRRTILTLPKMHLEWRSDLAPTLEALGAKTVFDETADFSAMVALPSPGDPDAAGLKISKVIHQTFLDVDEKGSEAAAATAVLNIVVTGRRPTPSQPFIFRADKPFLFLLRDNRTNLILFMGRYVAPPGPR